MPLSNQAVELKTIPTFIASRPVQNHLQHMSSEIVTFENNRPILHVVFEGVLRFSYNESHQLGVDSLCVCIQADGCWLRKIARLTAESSAGRAGSQSVHTPADDDGPVAPVNLSPNPGCGSDQLPQMPSSDHPKVGKDVDCEFGRNDSNMTPLNIG
ncbi:hypothetical protein PGT21_020251 [Puccinia graminis f. sp. tritici]|uniref:Uncharacterized protein n=1 Tax=Puccinia graminis f. sp. tritici TaxID=56615 RepID=A0A5B0Q6D6_PUCGR|nr:hypothetical protein PGT21_020251 [Puccinia graminis f. sp. tritici]